MINRVQNNKGFTLIELLLGMAIILILASGSYVGYIRFNKQQNVNIARDNLVNTLIEARSNAISQVITTLPPAGCKQASRTLIGNQVWFDTTTDPHSYLIQEVCSDGINPYYTPTVKRISLAQGISFQSTPGFVRFRVATGEVATPTTVIVKVKGSSNPSEWRTICVNLAGVIRTIKGSETC